MIHRQGNLRQAHLTGVTAHQVDVKDLLDVASHFRLADDLTYTYHLPCAELHLHVRLFSLVLGQVLSESNEMKISNQFTC